MSCGPTLETKLKTKEEIEKLVQNVSVMTKILEKAHDKRSGEDDKKMTEFIKRIKAIETVKALFASCPVSLRLNTSIYSEH